MPTLIVVVFAVAGLGAVLAVTPFAAMVSGTSSVKAIEPVNGVAEPRSMATTTSWVPPGGSFSAVGAAVNEYLVVCWPEPPVPVVPPLLPPPHPMTATIKAMEPKEVSLWMFTGGSSFCGVSGGGGYALRASTDPPHP